MLFLSDPSAALPIRLSLVAWVVAGLLEVISAISVWRYRVQLKSVNSPLPFSVRRRWQWHNKSLLLGAVLTGLNASDLSFGFNLSLLPVVNAVAAALLLCYAGQVRFDGLLMSRVIFYLYASSLAWCLAVGIVIEHRAAPNALWVLLNNLSWACNYLMLAGVLMSLLIYRSQVRRAVYSRRVRSVVEDRQRVQRAQKELINLS